MKIPPQFKGLKLAEEDRAERVKVVVLPGPFGTTRIGL